MKTETSSLHARIVELTEVMRRRNESIAIITNHYDILRSELVEMEARNLYGLFQAAANYKDMETCRTIANAKLSGKCSKCNGTGQLFKPASQTHDAESQECQHCKGNGFLEIPETPDTVCDSNCNTVSGRKRSLTVQVTDGMLTIQVGVETLAFAAEQHPTMGCPRVTDVDGFAEEIAEEMESETMGYNEISNVARFLDSMCESVFYGGSLCLEEV